MSFAGASVSVIIATWEVAASLSMMQKNTPKTPVKHLKDKKRGLDTSKLTPKMHKDEKEP